MKIYRLIKPLGARIVCTLNKLRHADIRGIEDVGVYKALPDSVVKGFNKRRLLGPQKLLCYAPFKMIYFAFNGEVIACCHNRRHIIGRYPAQRIEEIWNGESFNILRGYIQHNDLSYGCDVCKNALLAGNYEGAKNGLYDRYPVRPYPQIMEFELDNRCNLECVICNDIFSSSIDTKDLKTVSKVAYDDEFVKQLEPFIPKLKEAKFYGGEPFLINIYYNIWEKMLALNPHIEIVVQTNGTVLNERIKKLLERGRFNINISIDSLNKENFETIRKNASFENTIKNVDFFKNYCLRKGTHIGIIPTPNRLNWQDIPGLTNWASAMGAGIYYNTLITPLELALWNLPPEKLEAIHSELASKEIIRNNSVAKKNAQGYNDFLNQVKAWNTKNKNSAAENTKTKISAEDLKLMKEEFMQALRNSLNEEDRDELMLLSEQTIASLENISKSELFFAIIRKVPIGIVVEEVKKRDPEHLKKIIAKKIFEALGEYEIIES